MDKKWIVLIPAFEPESLFISLLEEIYQADFQIVVVDDGSGDSYIRLFEQGASFAVVLSHSKNRGKGCALKTGLTYILTHYDKDCIVVTMDSDGQHKTTDALRLCAAAKAHPDAVILGSRKLKSHVPLRSRFGNTVTRLIYRIATGLSVHDTQTGLRAFSIRLLPWLIHIPGERYEYEMNVLLACAKENIPIHELEIETIYFENNAGSHFDVLRDSCLIYREILKFSLSSFIGFLLDYLLYSILLILTAGWFSIAKTV